MLEHELTCHDLSECVTLACLGVCDLGLGVCDLGLAVCDLGLAVCGPSHISPCAPPH